MSRIYLEQIIPGLYGQTIATQLPVDLSNSSVAISSDFPAYGKTWCYLPKGWDAAWTTAKANNGTTPAWMVLIGDSIGQGFNASDMMSKSFYELVKANLKTMYSTYGDFYSTAHSVSNLSGFTGTPPWVIDSTNITWQQGYAYGKIGYYTSGTAATGMTFTTPYACTDLDIIYLDRNAGTWDYAVDGGSAVTITNAGTVNYQKRIQITGLANTTHTVVFNNQSLANIMMIIGVATYKSRTSGIGYGLMAYYGNSQDGAFNSGSLGPADRPSGLQGKHSATTGFGFPTQPSLAILEYGINDVVAGITTASFLDTQRRVIQGLRRGVDNCSILMLIPCNPDAVNSEVTSNNFTNSANWATFMQQIYSNAQMYNCAVVNIHAKWGETPVTKGFLTTSQPHPTDAGYADIAALLNTIL